MPRRVSIMMCAVKFSCSFASFSNISGPLSESFSCSFLGVKFYWVKNKLQKEMSVYISSPMYLLKHGLFEHIKFVPKVCRSCIFKYIAFSNFSSSKMCFIVYNMFFWENITVLCSQMFLEFDTQRLILCKYPRLRLFRILNDKNLSSWTYAIV